MKTSAALRSGPEMDWDHDGDEDYVDGMFDGAFWFGTPGVVALVVLISVGLWLWSQYG